MKHEGYGIYHDFVIDAPISKVFNAISDPEHLVNWWPLTCSGIPEIGTTYNFNFTSKYDWYGKVFKIETDKSFYIKMTKSNEVWNPTTFGFDIIKVTDKVEVRFSHTGWTSINEEYRQSSFCWAMLLNGLKNYIEKGVVIPFEERE